MFLVLIYSLINYQPLDYKGVKYPDAVYNFAWLIWAVGVGQLPFWAFYTIAQQSGKTFKQVKAKIFEKRKLRKNIFFKNNFLHRNCI